MTSNEPETASAPPVQYATVEQIEKAARNPRRLKDVTLPICGLTVQIQSLTEKEKSTIEAEPVNAEGNYKLKRVIDARRRLIQAAVVQPKLEPHHIEMLGGFDGADTVHLHNEIAEHCGWSKSDLEALEGK